MSGERRKEPWGRTAAFVADVIAATSTAHAASWLSGVNCDFTLDSIFTTGLGAERIIKNHSLLARKHRIRIFRCPLVTARFHGREAPRYGLPSCEFDGTAPDEQASDADRAELAQRLRGLGSTIRRSAQNHYLRQRAGLMRAAREEASAGDGGADA